MWSLAKRENYPYGYSVFVQRTQFPQQIRSRSEFNSDRSFWLDVESMKTRETMLTDRTIIVPNIPQLVMDFDLFKKPPVGYAMHVMHYKRWILDFMYKTANQYWNPFKVGYVGDPKSGWMPETPKKFKKEIHKLLMALLKYRSGSAMALPGYARVELLESKKTKADEFGTFIDVLNNEIMMYLMGSMGLRVATGTELASGRTISDTWLRFLEGKRRKTSVPFKLFWSKSLLPLHGKRVSPNDVGPIWPQLRLEDMDKIAKSIQLMSDSFTMSIKERRAAAKQVWEFIDPEDNEALTQLRQDFLKTIEKTPNVDTPRKE